MLTGERIPESILQRVGAMVVYLAFMSPFLLMGGGMVLVGGLALGPRKDVAELWICLPAGLALLGALMSIVWWAAWRVPELTVTRFEFVGAQLIVETPAWGTVTLPVEALRAVSEEHRRRRRPLRGWWLRFDGAGSVYLTRDTPQAEELVERLKASLGRQGGTVNADDRQKRSDAKGLD